MGKLAAFVLAPFALFAYCWRHGARLGWYRGCGRPMPERE